MQDGQVGILLQTLKQETVSFEENHHEGFGLREMCVRGGRWLQHLDYPCPHSSQCKQTCNVENPNQTLELHRSSRQMRLCSFVIIRNNRPPREDVGFISVCTFPLTSSLSLRQFIHFEFCLVYSSLCYCQSMLRTLLHFIALSVCRFERTVCVYQIHCMRCMYFDTYFLIVSLCH